MTTEQACRFVDTSSDFSSWLELHQRALNDRLVPRQYAGGMFHGCLQQVKTGLCRCQFSIEETTSRIMSMCDWRLNRQNIFMVIFTVSQTEVLATVSRVNASGVEMTQYRCSGEAVFDEVMGLVRDQYHHQGSCYVFMPGKSRRHHYTGNGFCHRLSHASIKAWLPESCIIHMEQLSRYFNQRCIRRVGSDANYWLEVSRLGVSSGHLERMGIYREDNDMLKSVLYADLAELLKIVVCPVPDGINK